MKKMICAMIMVLGMVMMVGCNGANDKEEATNNDELYRVNIEDPISGCRVERGNKIYSLSGFVSAEKAEEFGITGSYTKTIPYEEQFRDDTHLRFEAVFLYDDDPSESGIVIAGDQDPFAINGEEKIICYSDGLRFYSIELGDYVTLDDGSVARLYLYRTSDSETVSSEDKGEYWEYDISSLTPGYYHIDFSGSSCPYSWSSIITIK